MNDRDKSTIQIKLDWRLVSALLLIVLIAMLAIWQPWQAITPAKTITVRGEANVKATPDSFQFNAIFVDTDNKKATATGNEAVVQLKKLGVADADIKTQASTAQDDRKPTPEEVFPAPGYNSKASYSISITAHTKDQAQKIADYLATTTATGQLTPQSGFSTETRKRLDLEARSKASDDAKTKAAVMAKQLGGRVGKVVKIIENNGYDIYQVDDARGEGAPSKSSVSSGPTVQPGTDEVNYMFTVVFELK